MSISRKSAKKQHRCACGRRFRTATRLAAHRQNCESAQAEAVEAEAPPSEAEAPKTEAQPETLDQPEAPAAASTAKPADEPEFAPVPQADKPEPVATLSEAEPAAEPKTPEAQPIEEEGAVAARKAEPVLASQPEPLLIPLEKLTNEPVSVVSERPRLPAPEPEEVEPVSLEWLYQHQLRPVVEPREELHPGQLLYREFFRWLKGEILGIFRCFCLLLSGSLVLAAAVAVCFGLGLAWKHLPGQAPPDQRLSDASQTVVDFHRALMAGAQRSAATQLARRVDFSGMPRGDLRVVSIRQVSGCQAHVDVHFSVGARGVFSTVHDGYRWRIDGFAVQRDFAHL